MKYKVKKTMVKIAANKTGHFDIKVSHSWSIFVQFLDTVPLSNGVAGCLLFWGSSVGNSDESVGRSFIFTIGVLSERLTHGVVARFSVLSQKKYREQYIKDQHRCYITASSMFMNYTTISRTDGQGSG